MSGPPLSDREADWLEWLVFRLDMLAFHRMEAPLTPGERAEWDQLVAEQKELLARRVEPGGTEA